MARREKANTEINTSTTDDQAENGAATTASSEATTQNDRADYYEADIRISFKVDPAKMSHLVRAAGALLRVCDTATDLGFVVTKADAGIKRKAPADMLPCDYRGELDSAE